jgi:very-short-patch-repair endonuclease
MRRELIREVSRRGVITRTDALRVVAEHILDDAVADGALARIFPEVFCVPEQSDDREVRRHGALLYQPRGALSHLDALDLWGLLPNPAHLGMTLHVTTDRSISYSDWPGLELHRRRGFVRNGSDVVVRGGLSVVRLEQAVVESWAMLPPVDRRVPAIVALRERRTTGGRLLQALEHNGRTIGAAEMRRVFALAANGCHSPLEMWGHERIFSDSRLPPSRCQVPLRLSIGVIYLDRLYDEEQLNVELDGAAYHGAPGQRERDLRRDAALATLGIQTVRYSHPRLHGDPDGVRQQTLDILATRRRQLRPPRAS